MSGAACQPAPTKLRQPAPKSGAESAEVRKSKRGAGSRGAVECGRSAEEVRNLSTSAVSPPPNIQPVKLGDFPAPALVRARGRKPREDVPGPAPTGRGDDWPADCPPSLARGLPAPEQAVIDAALAILARRVREPGTVIDSPGAARELVRLHLAQCERERFGVLFVDSQHAVIGFEVLFEGTLTQTAVMPREIVRRALQLNAGAVILAHNHPSGSAEPSKADAMLTVALKQALALVDVRVLDHVVVGWTGIVSMAERGLM
jgi:DNA repair protein RadC